MHTCVRVAPAHACASASGGTVPGLLQTADATGGFERAALADSVSTTPGGPCWDPGSVTELEKLQAAALHFDFFT